MSGADLTRILVIEDNPGDARLLREMFNEKPSDRSLSQVGTAREAEAHLAAHGVDVILLDLGLPDAQGLDALRRVRSAAPRVPLVVLTGFDDEALAALALKEGAQDYLIKGEIDAKSLLRALRYAIERNAMEEALFTEKERALVSLKSIGEGVVCTDTQGNITFLNLVAETMTGWPLPQAAGRPLHEVLPILDASTRQPLLTHFQLPTDPSVLPRLGILVRRDGLEMPIEGSAAVIHDRMGHPAGAVVVFRDVTTARAMSQEMARAAQHDFLTQLPNRGLLTERITQALAIAARHESRVAVLFLDLDGFKHINDSLGHSTGDRVLQSVAIRLDGCVRDTDTVSRQGGDEFVVLLSDISSAEAAAISATRMLRVIAAAHSIDGTDLHITTSIGISVYPEDGQDAETLIKNADTAMYQAKENGRQGYQFFTPTMNVRAVERQFIAEGLRRAIAKDELSLHYQPVIDVRTGEITGAEALTRWTHPARGPIAPDDFIPIAEDSGLIIPIGRWVMREACSEAQRWTDAGLGPITIAVNVSAMEFQDHGFLTGVLGILADTGLDPRRLVIELTESVLMRRVEATAEVLQSLRERGVRVAVDDFGTGYSSLSYLRKFPVDALKIDQSFIRQITTEGRDTTLVTAVIHMARSLKLRVIAEGVENVDELAFLKEHLCDGAQGYLFSRPIPGPQFMALLAASSVHPVQPAVTLTLGRVRGAESMHATADGLPPAVVLDRDQTGFADVATDLPSATAVATSRQHADRSG
ncbi:MULTISPECIES: EAL domain-containing response regulator [Cryobacterium]|uniref:Two-component system response regulator n=1 Tax=Cryobacterium zongtaii TaxID=1259217 RepID=A0A2S3ZAX5_9MICO|nr:MULTISPECIES: EAL domain-containing protein [Cryobacterium]POH62690.1 two-component system response regulator [Cryobacterium zongtaii]POH69859.1 two-component system response regulator [Cryobacterium zongtaii]TFC42876.1 EAL domain-containing protein [Cryobacterium sp. TMN-39-2]